MPKPNRPILPPPSYAPPPLPPPHKTQTTKRATQTHRAHPSYPPPPLPLPHKTQTTTRAIHTHRAPLPQTQQYSEPQYSEPLSDKSDRKKKKTLFSRFTSKLGAPIRALRKKESFSHPKAKRVTVDNAHYESTDNYDRLKQIKTKAQYANIRTQTDSDGYLHPVDSPLHKQQDHRNSYTPSYVNITAQPEYVNTKGQSEYAEPYGASEDAESYSASEYAESYGASEYAESYGASDLMVLISTHSASSHTKPYGTEYINTKVQPEYINTKSQPEYINTKVQPEYAELNAPEHVNTTAQSGYVNTKSQSGYVNTTAQSEYEEPYEPYNDNVPEYVNTKAPEHAEALFTTSTHKTPNTPKPPIAKAHGDVMAELRGKLKSPDAHKPSKGPPPKLFPKPSKHPSSS